MPSPTDREVEAAFLAILGQHLNRFTPENVHIKREMPVHVWRSRIRAALAAAQQARSNHA